MKSIFSRTAKAKVVDFSTPSRTQKITLIRIHFHGTPQLFSKIFKGKFFLNPREYRRGHFKYHITQITQIGPKRLLLKEIIFKELHINIRGLFREEFFQDLEDIVEDFLNTVFRFFEPTRYSVVLKSLYFQGPSKP